MSELEHAIRAAYQPERTIEIAGRPTVLRQPSYRAVKVGMMEVRARHPKAMAHNPRTPDSDFEKLPQAEQSAVLIDLEEFDNDAARSLFRLCHAPAEDEEPLSDTAIELAIEGDPGLADTIIEMSGVGRISPGEDEGEGLPDPLA